MIFFVVGVVVGILLATLVVLLEFVVEARTHRTATEHAERVVRRDRGAVLEPQQRGAVLSNEKAKTQEWIERTFEPEPMPDEES